MKSKAAARVICAVVLASGAAAGCSGGQSDLQKWIAETKKKPGGRIQALPEVKPKMIKQVRARFHCSRSVFARKLFTNERTLEKWEQGRAKPTAQAAALLLLAARYPDTFERLEQLAR